MKQRRRSRSRSPATRCSAPTTANNKLASQVQYAMSKDDAALRNAPGAGMSNGQGILAKTVPRTAPSSRRLIGASEQTMAVALFTNEQGSESARLNRPWRCSAGGPRAAWRNLAGSYMAHYAENMFVPSGSSRSRPGLYRQPWNRLHAEPGQRRQGSQRSKDHGGRKKGGQGGDQGPPHPRAHLLRCPQVVT